VATRYPEIAADLRSRIEAGQYPPGSKLPGYAELTEIYGVGRGVLQLALNVLESEGLITVVKKRGILVRNRAGRRRAKRGQLVTRSALVGYVFPAATGPDERWGPHGQPRAGLAPVPASVAELLGLTASAEVLRRRRVTSPVGESPFQLADTWIHPDAVADAPQVAEPSTGPGGFIDRLEEAGHGPMSWQEITRVRMPDPEEARLLDMSNAMPVLELSRVGKSARTGQPIEVTVCVIPADRVEIVTDLRRGSSAQWPVNPIEPQ
jgi:DNA-binding GntR family transcriptional regulator